MCKIASVWQLKYSMSYNQTIKEEASIAFT